MQRLIVKDVTEQPNPHKPRCRAHQHIYYFMKTQKASGHVESLSSVIENLTLISLFPTPFDHFHFHILAPKGAPGGSVRVSFGEFEQLNALGAILWWEVRFHLLGQFSDNDIIKLLLTEKFHHFHTIVFLPWRSSEGGNVQ